MRPGWRRDMAGDAPPLAVIGLVLTAGLVLVAVGMGVGRATAGEPAQGAMPSSGALPVVGLPAMPAGGVGPRGVSAGVPVGYDHSPQGARMAAAVYGEVLASGLVVHPDAYRAAMQAMAAPSAQETLRAQADTLLTGAESANHLISNAAHGLPVVVQAWPLAGRVTAYDGITAHVEILEAGVVGVGTTAPQGFFDGGDWTLQWTTAPGQGGDWRVVAMHTIRGWTSTAASWPQLGMALPFLSDLEPLGDVPAAPAHP